MRLLINLYARLIFSLFVFLARSTYREVSGTNFSADKHNDMMKRMATAKKVFSLMVKPVGKKTIDDYAMPINYEGCKLVIRPFIFSEVIMVSGLWEPYVKVILDTDVKKNDTVIDIGAHIGIYAIPLAKRVNKVIAFEPHPKTFQLLNKSAELNHLDNIILIRKSVGDSQKRELFHLTDIPMISGVSVSKLAEGTRPFIEIESVDLNYALAKENRVDWLLVDVEGSEVRVLNGARGVLKKHSPKIIIEVLSENGEQINKILLEAGYSMKQLFRDYYYAEKKEVISGMI